MKSLPIVLTLSIFANLASARDFLPESHMENIPAGDASIQQCYVFHTTPGLLYTVEYSNDLAHWTAQDEIYGLGHEYVVTMHKFTPAPPLPPETPPASTQPPSINVSLRMQPASGEDGGTIVSWVSLDHSGPVIVRIAGELASAWNLIPLYVSHPGTYTYFVWHPGNTLSPPESNPPLGTKDSAMLAALEADLPAMNTEVENSVERARNAPAPPPPDLDSKRFWRVHVNADIDTDQDGSPDWAEFEIAARGTGVLVAGATTDAFNGDTNGDGIPDGEQLDADLDGTADAKDPDASDNTVTFPIGPLPRYALFPITHAQPDSEFPDPLQISDKGTVLYADRTWTSGVWTALLSPLEANGGRAGFAKAINDFNTILGFAYSEVLISEDTWGYACYWPDPASQLTLVDAGDLRAEFTGYGTFNGEFEHDLWSGPLLADDGGFYFSTTRLNESTGFYEPFRYSRWKLPSSGAMSETEAEPGLHYSNGPELQWGHDEIHEMVQGHNNEHLNGVVWTTAAMPALPFMPTNVSSQPNGSVVAMSGGGQVKVFVNGAWKDSTTYANAIDISSDGTAIGRNHGGLTAPICLNGKWTDIGRATPLKLKTVGDDLKFGNETEITLSSPSQMIPISRDTAIPNLNIPIEMYFGDIKSDSRPVFTKVMKARTVNVWVYKIAKVTGNTLSPDLVPSEPAIKKHLDNLFGPQINVRFTVHVVTDEIPVTWSDLMESAIPNTHSTDQLTILASLPADPLDTTINIRVLLIGSVSLLDSGGTSLGLTNQLARTCWVLARSRVNYRKKKMCWTPSAMR